MASELRWILLGLSVLLLGGIWWWGMRRSRRSPGNSQLRETGTGSAAMGPTILGPTIMGPTPETHADETESREWGVPPFEPLNIRTAEFDQGAIEDLPMSATADPLDLPLHMDPVRQDPVRQDPVRDEPTPSEPDAPDEPLYDADVAPAPAAAAPVPAAVPAAAPAAAPAAPAAAPPPNSSEAQRIVTVRVCAAGAAQWHGADLLAALEEHGLGYGRYKVFHRKHGDGRTLFCAASLVEPGTFDLARMPHEEFRGLTLFAVLPGPADALETIDTLIATAVNLADTLHGTVQDARGVPLSPERAEALREDVAHFQQSLSRS